MRNALHHTGTPGERRIERRCNVVYWSNRNLTCEQGEPVLGRVPAQLLIQHRDERFAVLPTPVSGGKTPVLGQVRTGDDIAKDAPELLGHAHDEDPAIRGGKGLDRHLRKMRAARQTLWLVTGVQVPHPGVGELMEGDIEQAGIDVTAA